MAAPPMAPNSLTFVEKGLEALDGSGLGDAGRLRVIGLDVPVTPARLRRRARLPPPAPDRLGRRDRRHPGLRRAGGVPLRPGADPRRVQVL